MICECHSDLLWKRCFADMLELYLLSLAWRVWTVPRILWNAAMLRHLLFLACLTSHRRYVRLVVHLTAVVGSVLVLIYVRFLPSWRLMFNAGSTAATDRVTVFLGLAGAFGPQWCWGGFGLGKIVWLRAKGSWFIEVRVDVLNRKGCELCQCQDLKLTETCSFCSSSSNSWLGPSTLFEFSSESTGPNRWSE